MVVIASHYPFYDKKGLYFSRIYQERSYILAVTTKEKYLGGMYINAEQPTRSLRSQAFEKGELILVAGEHHKTGQGESTVNHYENLWDFANQIFTVESAPYRWSTQDCMTMDGVPYVGKLTSHSNSLYIATGFCKWGMTNSTSSAMILRDLIVKGESPWAPVYDPTRFIAPASTMHFIKENLNVAGEMIKGKLENPKKDVDLQPGEGKVVDVKGQRAGAYKDEKGNIFIVDTTCTHMGCELQWNPAERTWDCPCHGSRFSFEGDVVDGPAKKPLPRLDQTRISK